jgi:molecular chaperone DnaK
MGKVIGIDLGTTNSCVAVMQGDQAEVIANAEGARTTPSMVAYTTSGEKLVGQIAKRQAVTNPECTMHAVKRLIGRKFDDKETKESIEASCRTRSSPPPTATPGSRCSARSTRRRRSPPSRSQDEARPPRRIPRPPGARRGDHRPRLLQRRAAPGDQGRRQDRRPRGPAHHQRADGRRARLRHQAGHRQEVAVYDLGGGTFDVSILEIADGVFEVLSTNGDTFLGGEDFDNVLVGTLADRFEKENGIDLARRPMALQRLKEAAEKAKHRALVVDRDRHQPAVHRADDEGPRISTSS